MRANRKKEKTTDPAAAVGSQGNPPTAAPQQPAVPPTPAEQKAERPMLLTITAWLFTALLLGAAILYGLGYLATGSGRPWKKLGTTDYYDLTRSTVALTGLLGAAVAAGLATRRQRSQERAVNIAAETQLISAQTYALEQQRAARDDIRNLRDRYSVASEQLGSSSAAVRLAGVYAMAALADDWAQQGPGVKDSQACIDVLCAFLRTPQHGGELDPETGHPVPPDVEVRRTIVNVIAEHLRPESVPSWSDHRFDFNGSHFDFDVGLADCTFRNVADFSRVTVAAKLDLSGARFLKKVGGAADQKVSFEGAKFQRQAIFTSAVAERHVSFDNANFDTGRVVLRQFALRDAFMTFRNSKFDGAEVVFEGMEIYGVNDLRLSGCPVTAGHLSLAGLNIYKTGSVSVESVEVTGGLIDFSLSKIEGRLRIASLDQREGDGRVRMNEMTISGGTVELANCELVGERATIKANVFESDGHIVFRQTTGTSIPGPWESPSLPERWPLVKDSNGD